jgi:hypothetical protein
MIAGCIAAAARDFPLLQTNHTHYWTHKAFFSMGFISGSFPGSKAARARE